MKAVIVLFVLSCVLALAYGDLVCGTDYCKKNPCSNDVTPSSCVAPKVYHAKHGGKCGCCPTCVTLLYEGAPCTIYSREIGQTPSSICSRPLRCISGVCTKITPRV